MEQHIDNSFLWKIFCNYFWKEKLIRNWPGVTTTWKFARRCAVTAQITCGDFRTSKKLNGTRQVNGSYIQIGRNGAI